MGDPLGVRQATAWVVERAEDVSLDTASIDRVAQQIASSSWRHPAWRGLPHWWSDADPAATAMYVLVLDALNFSFWGEPRWTVTYHGQTYGGYWALAASIRAAIERGEPILDPQYLADQTNLDVLLAGDAGSEIPLIGARATALREVGRGIMRRYEGSFLNALHAAGGSGLELARGVTEEFPMFRDVAAYRGRPVPLYKRAQILVADLWGALGGQSPANFTDLADLTMFADYKVPQVLHTAGVLKYSAALTSSLERGEELLPGDPREVEIRAASVQAVELIQAELARIGTTLPPFRIDWILWTLGQTQKSALPYHRTRTTAY